MDSKQGQDDEGKVVVRGDDHQVAGITRASIRSAAKFCTLSVFGQASHLRACEVQADRVADRVVLGSRAYGDVEIFVIRLRRALIGPKSQNDP